MTSSRPPGVGVMRLASTSSTTPTGRSFNSATRSRSAGSNSISPRIARSVMPATCAFRPAKSASSSMHSWPIMVESMSARKSFLRRSTGRLHDNVDRQVAARLAQAGFDRRDVVGFDCRRRECRPRPRRTAIAPGRARAERRSAPSTMVLSSAGLAGLQISVATRDMQANSHRDLSKAVLIAGPTASGKSALALELAQKTGGVVINADSMQVYRDLRIITARPTPDEEARVPHRLYGHVDAAVNFSAGAWVADAASVLAEARAQNRAADLHRRLRPVLQGADARPFRGAADPAGDTRRRSRAAGTRWRRGAACRAGAARSGLRRTPEAARPHPHRARAGSGRGHRPFADRLASRRPAAAAAARANSARCFSRRSATQLYARIDARFDAMLDAGALEEVARARPRDSSIRCCRR